MTEKQKKEVEIQRSVMSLMEQNLTVWQSIPVLKYKYDHFVRNIKKINDHLEITGTDLAPFRESKLRSMKTLLEQAFPVISVLGVFGRDTGNTKLNKMVNHNADELETMNPDALRKYFRRILRLSRALMEPYQGDGSETPARKISDYGLKEKHLVKIETALNQFISDADTYKEKRKQLKSNKLQLDRRIRDNRILLKTQLSKLILLFRDSHKDFYREYLSAIGKSS
jgi:hypothetical protein